MFDVHLFQSVLGKNNLALMGEGLETSEVRSGPGRGDGNGNAFDVKALRRINGVSCLKIKRLGDLEIESLICETLPTLCE